MGTGGTPRPWLGLLALYTISYRPNHSLLIRWSKPKFTEVDPQEDWMGAGPGPDRELSRNPSRKKKCREIERDPKEAKKRQTNTFGNVLNITMQRRRRRSKRKHVSSDGVVGEKLLCRNCGAAKSKKKKIEL